MSLPSITLPRLGKKVTRLGFGALPMGPLQRGISPEEGGRVVRAAVEGGITFIDTATMYGTYEHIAKGLDGFKGEVVISTKTQARNDRALAGKHIEMARSGLKRDCLDIMLCHCGRDAYSKEEWGGAMDTLLAARAQGKIKMVGVSCHSVEGVRIAAKMPEIEVIHPLYNLIGMGIIGGDREEMGAAIAEAHAAGKFIYGMKALAGGNLVSRREEALRFAWEAPFLDSFVLGMVTPDEVEWNLNFFQGNANSEALTKRTAINSKRIKILDFVCKGCGNCVKHCENGALSLVNGKAVVNQEKCILCGYCAPHCPLFAIRMV